MGALRSLSARIGRHKRRARNILLSAITALIVVAVLYSYLFGPSAKYAKAEQFVITPGTPTSEVARQLKDQGFVKSAWVARVVLASKSKEGVRPGGYDISKHMDLWTLSEKFAAPPYMVFVTIPESVRKEEIGEILARELRWDEEQKQEWERATTMDADLTEGVYYPDTYLIPGDQPPASIAARLRGRFADVFAAYADEARAKGMDWNDVLTLASLVDKEAAADDKHLVAGILWNRVEKGMLLQVDATLQYIRGNEDDWWPVPRSSDKYLDSPFNTYQHGGLPPHPINNPRVESVEAVLNPTSTDCLFYIHSNQQIYCSVTYAGQEANVDRYLR
ncbi:MAG: hypothetical protein QOE22_59 [Candidatus Parcubacteria bacterium]|jgi:UPF0755 protein|nr:hypothetical protein [Candidatus Parcubacteria bacterium]